MTDRRALMMRDWGVSIMVSLALTMGLCDKSYASDPQSLADVRCVVVGMRMIEMAAPDQRAAGMMIATYYFGRLDSSLPDDGGERLIELEAVKMTLAEFRTNAARCGEAIQKKGQEIQKIGAILSRQNTAE